jgi:hypothetical protein
MLILRDVGEHVGIEGRQALGRVLMDPDIGQFDLNLTAPAAKS